MLVLGWVWLYPWRHHWSIKADFASIFPGLYSGDRSSVRRSGRLSAQKKTHQSPAGPTSSPVFQAGYQTPIRKKKKPCRGSKGSKEAASVLHLCT